MLFFLWHSESLFNVHLVTCFLGMLKDEGIYSFVVHVTVCSWCPVSPILTLSQLE